MENKVKILTPIIDMIDYNQSDLCSLIDSFYDNHNAMGKYFGCSEDSVKMINLSFLGNILSFLNSGVNRIIAKHIKDNSDSEFLSNMELLISEYFKYIENNDFKKVSDNSTAALSYNNLINFFNKDNYFTSEIIDKNSNIYYTLIKANFMIDEVATFVIIDSFNDNIIKFNIIEEKADDEEFKLKMEFQFLFGLYKGIFSNVAIYMLSVKDEFSDKEE